MVTRTFRRCRSRCAGIVVCGLLVVSLAGCASAYDQALTKAYEWLDRGNAATAKSEYGEAVESYEKGVQALVAADLEQTEDIPEDIRLRLAEIRLLLTRNEIAARFLAGQQWMEKAEQELMQVVQQANQSGRGDPRSASVATRSFQQAYQYLERDVQRIDELATQRPGDLRLLDASVRFAGPWPAKSADNGYVGFSEYYRGGSYVLLSLAATCLGDLVAEDAWTEQVYALGYDDLLRVFEDMRADVAPLVNVLLEANSG